MIGAPSGGLTPWLASATFPEAIHASYPRIPVPKKPNYDFEKRRREQQRQAKKDAKLEEKARRREAERAAGQPNEGVEPPAAE